MASADITAKETRLKGVNSFDNYIRRETHLIDGAENAGILAADTHSLFIIPKGNMLTGLKVLSLETAASSGSATAQFKASINSVAEALHTAIGKADLAAGDVAVIPVEKIKGYDASYDTVIQLTVGTAAFTTLKLLVVAEYIPVTEFLTAG